MIRCSSLLICSPDLLSVSYSLKTINFLSLLVVGLEPLISLVFENSYASVASIEKAQMKSASDFRPGAIPCLDIFKASLFSTPKKSSNSQILRTSNFFSS